MPRCGGFSHGQLGARLADRLGGDDAHRFADVDPGAARQIAAVAGAADPDLAFADQDRADLHRLDRGPLDDLDLDLVQIGVGGHDDLARGRVLDVLGRRTTEDALAERDQHVAALDHGAQGDALRGAAILLGDDAVLRDVDETPRQGSPRVGGLQRGVLARPLRAPWVELKCSSTVRPSLKFEMIGVSMISPDSGLAAEAAHAAELLHLGLRTAGAGVGHHARNGVDLQLAAVGAFLGGRDLQHHLVGDPVRGLGPGVDHLVVLLALGDQAVGVLLLVLLDQLAGFGHQHLLAGRDDDVVLAEGDAGLGRFLEAEAHDLIGEDHRRLLAAVPVDGVDQVADLLLGQGLGDQAVTDVAVLREQRRDLHPSRRGVDDPDGLHAVVRAGLLETGLDLGVQGHDAGVEGRVDLTQIREQLALAGLPVLGQGQVVEAEHDVLRGHDDRPAVGQATEHVVGRHHQHARFQHWASRLSRERARPSGRRRSRR